MLVEAQNYKNIDMEYKLHKLAFLNFQVKGMKKAGKGKERPIYRTFKSFFDYEKLISRLEHREDDERFRELSKHIKKEGGE